MHRPRKVKPIVSSHKKGTAPEKKQANICLLSQERDRSKSNRLLCHLTRQGLLLKTDTDPNQKLSQQITKCEWISGTLSQHVAWLCDSRFLSHGVQESIKVVRVHGTVQPPGWPSVVPVLAVLCPLVPTWVFPRWRSQVCQCCRLAFPVSHVGLSTLVSAGFLQRSLISLASFSVVGRDDHQEPQQVPQPG